MTGSNLVCVWIAYRTRLITRLQSNLETPENMFDHLKRPYTLFVSVSHLSNKQQSHGLTALSPLSMAPLKGRMRGRHFVRN